MKNPKIGDYLLWKGELAKVISETSLPTVEIQMIEGGVCHHCGNIRKLSVVTSSNYFQENSEPIKSI